jgi:hypothetical protein
MQCVACKALRARCGAYTLSISTLQTAISIAHTVRCACRVLATALRTAINIANIAISARPLNVALPLQPPQETRKESKSVI